MWIVDVISAIVGPTVGKFVDIVFSSFLGIFILLWNISPIALILFVVVLVALYKFSEKIGTLLLGLGATYAAYHFDHPIIAFIIFIATFQILFSSSDKSTSESMTEKKKKQVN